MPGGVGGQRREPLPTRLEKGQGRVKRLDDWTIGRFGDWMIWRLDDFDCEMLNVQF